MQAKTISAALIAGLLAVASLPALTASRSPQASPSSNSTTVEELSDMFDVQSRTPATVMKLATSSGHGTSHATMAGPSYTIGDLVISNVRAGATVPKAPVAGGYMVIKNKGSKSDFLIGGEAAFSGEVQIHEMKMEGDVMKMRELSNGLEIPAGGEVMLKPGGFHVMFMKLTEPLTDGESRKATLIFRDAGRVEVDFKVKDRKHLNGHDHSGHDHGSHGSSN